MNDLIKNVMLWVVIAVILMVVFNNIGGQSSTANTVPYSDFYSEVRTGGIERVTIAGKDIRFQESNGNVYSTYSPETDNKALIGELIDAGVQVNAEPPEDTNFFVQLFLNTFPFLIFVGIWIYFLRQMQGGGGGRGAMSFGKSKARLMGEDQVKVTFADVAGVEEAKDEVSELVEFLRDPGKFQKLGGKIPRGVLLVGSPGTGKTLLAKAIAGEAKVPFFTISGSDFVEMFVGVGASRVRDMFEQAKKHAPCIIFIDEIDAVGRHRGAGLGGGHDEREQTLNQLLVEMDGFEGNEGIIVIAATNRPDVLDPALLRPGRFDRQVVVPLPDVRGREKILQVHMSKVPVADDVRPDLIARGTPGFSGADLANLVNEAALFAARKDKSTVEMAEFDRAKDKIMMGAERRSMVMTEEDKKQTAYHEAGHAIVARLVPQHDPVYKVTIIPRGRALGLAQFLPEKDKISASKLELESMISVAYGGRIAEDIIYGEDNVTTGASSDIETATKLARNMVTMWGLSDNLGPLAYGEEQGEVFLGRGQTQPKQISDATKESVDAEVRAIIDRNYQRAEEILKDNLDTMHLMADALMKYETIDASQIDSIMEGKMPDPPADWTDNSQGGDGPQNGSAVMADEKPDEKLREDGAAPPPVSDPDPDPAS